MWNRAGSSARRIVGFGPRGAEPKMEEPMALEFSICEVHWERYRRVAENPPAREWLKFQATRGLSREHDRSLRARPGLLSRVSGDRKYPVSLGHSSDDRSLHSEHHSARGSEGFEKGDRSKKHSRERDSATAPHSGSPLS